MKSIKTVTITNPTNPTLIWRIIAQPLLPLLSFLVGRLARFLLRGRISVLGAAATPVMLVSLWLELLLAGWTSDEGDLFSLRMLTTSCGVAVVMLVATFAVLVRTQHHPTLLPIVEVAQMGGSDRLEFKSSARWNLHTGKRDKVTEEVAARTMAAFMDSTSDTLLFGVDDGGSLIGFGPDYATLKQPNVNRFELQLHGMWRTCVGTSAAALPQVDLAPTPDGTAEVYRMTAPPSSLSVYPKPAKGHDGAALWVRIGNSTRHLETDNAASYIMLRWLRIDHVAWSIRLGGFLLRRGQSCRALPTNPATTVTAAAGSRDDEGTGQ